MFNQMLLNRETKPVSEIVAYCRLEGIDPIFVSPKQKLGKAETTHKSKTIASKRPEVSNKMADWMAPVMKYLWVANNPHK